MTDPLEVELKLELDPADRDRLVLAGPLAGTDGETGRLIATYFDTPDLDVRKAGYSLRIRREGDTRIQTVKTDGAAAGLFARGEWAREVDADRPVLDGASGPLAQAVRRAALERLDGLFVTDVMRTTRTLTVEGARFELAIDEGEIRAGKRTTALCEIELELGSGSPRSLFDFARRLNEAVPLRIGVASKAERGYGLIDGDTGRAVKTEPLPIDPDGEAGDVFQTIARSCLRQFRLNETILLESGAVEPLHQARVGLRRLRSAFSLYKPLFVDDDRAGLLSAELRWLAAQLGEARNIDVLIERVSGDLRDRLVAAREGIFEGVHAELVSARTRLLMIDLAEWLTLGDWRSHPGDPALLHRNVALFAEDLFEVRRRRLKHRGKGLAAMDDGQRHKVRIEAKKLRYAAQFFASLYATGKARHRHTLFLEALEALQDHLGELNDLVVAPRLLARLGIDATLPDAGGHSRAKLLKRAEDAYDTLIDAKRFWR